MIKFQEPFFVQDGSKCPGTAYDNVYYSFSWINQGKTPGTVYVKSYDNQSCEILSKEDTGFSLSEDDRAYFYVNVKPFKNVERFSFAIHIKAYDKCFYKICEYNVSYYGQFLKTKEEGWYMDPVCI
jgi:hypothetical protein